MKKTKTISMILTAAITAGLFCAVLFAACTKGSSGGSNVTPANLCASVTCQNGGACSPSTGLCTCILNGGYSGTYCQTAYNDAFAGTWTGTTCNGNSGIYIITASSTNPFSLSFSVPFTFATCGTGFTANFIGTISNASQYVFSTNTYSVTDGCGNGYGINGVGEILGNTLQITFNIASATGVKQCTFTGTK